MKLRKTIGTYSIIVGVAMISIWIIQLLTGQAPELHTAPIEIALAIIADWLTAFILITAGSGLLLRCSWARMLSLFSLGMLVYSVLISAGYFGQLASMIFVALFALLFVLSVSFVVINIYEKNRING